MLSKIFFGPFSFFQNFEAAFAQNGLKKGKALHRPRLDFNFTTNKGLVFSII
jgi:hypothetical protein